MEQAPRITIHIPATLREYTSGESELGLSAKSVRAALKQLEASHPALYRSVCDETRTLRRHMNLFVNTSLLRWPEGLDEELASGDVISIMTAVSGG
jgi:molybdopterin converting factor small subunit